MIVYLSERKGGDENQKKNRSYHWCNIRDRERNRAGAGAAWSNCCYHHKRYTERRANETGTDTLNEE